MDEKTIDEEYNAFQEQKFFYRDISNVLGQFSEFYEELAEYAQNLSRKKKEAKITLI